VCGADDDRSLRQSLIARLDEKHFTVTYMSESAEAVKALQQRPFKVILISVEPDPELRAYAGVAHETLLKPVDRS
jgi:DNA-binding NtrC family response regulator